jgi:nucleoside-diphosphate-sugar epimerase
LKIKVYNKGDHIRDFTYIDDITDGIIKAYKPSFHPPKIINVAVISSQRLAVPLSVSNQIALDIE